VAAFNLYPAMRGSELDDIGVAPSSPSITRHCIGRPSIASFSARTNCTAKDSVSLGMAEEWQADRRDARSSRGLPTPRQAGSRNELSTRWVCSKMPIERTASVVSSP
jgi:hypothetical protein